VKEHRNGEGERERKATQARQSARFEEGTQKRPDATVRVAAAQKERSNASFGRQEGWDVLTAGENDEISKSEKNTGGLQLRGRGEWLQRLVAL